MSTEIRALKKKHNKYMKHSRYYMSFANITVDYILIDMIVDDLTNELFVAFGWDHINTTHEIKWKEYFHALYDLVVFDHKAIGHASSIMLLRNIAINYEIVREPRCEKTPQIEKIYNLFKKLKTEHLNVIHFNLDNLFDCLNESVRISTQIQCDALIIQQQIESVQE